MIEALTEPESAQRRHLSALRAAKAYGQRPTAMLLHDPYAGHRKHWRFPLWGEVWQPTVADREWTRWDYVLADVLQVVEDFTDAESGQLMHLDQSGDVWWDARRVESGYLAAVEKARSDKDEPGVRWYAVPVFDPNKPKPTVKGWLEERAVEGGGDVLRRPSDRKGARPPTVDEMRALKDMRVE